MVVLSGELEPLIVLFLELSNYMFYCCMYLLLVQVIVAVWLDDLVHSMSHLDHLVATEELVDPWYWW